MADALVLRDLGVSLADGDRGFALRVPELSIAAGETVGLTGPSGTGKTLLLELLGLLRVPDAGGVYRLCPGDAPERDLTALWTRRGRIARLRGRLFGFVPQTGGLLPFLTLSENVALPQRICGRPDPGLVRDLIDRLGLGPVAGLRPERLSIGQRQRAAIARALAHRPRFVIADEPTAALDPENAAEAMTLLFEAAGRTGSAVIVSSHDLDLLGRFALTRYRLALDPDHAPGRPVSRLIAAEDGPEAA
ncbi:ABC transporter [Rhodovulum sulfidophilum]|uniref:ATP-binding cassette domain-containing protein n=1 Tax=Rhodovulum visakhapatnamense TaxID=364297 RepID=A0ABS1RJW1_9RHOB|nr:ATP-binding cassette domain-containing protein [Rhodovulum visakhapatnamense]MBL3569621.1 ATP-binding cassette domain-containing protein [Rhodovulum visakhapatnamense]MBL3579800.1 ATP-binding cassette domain-containing protein [Rhodovulum visakhapatnamense]OLS45235.1 ABC transporter [Rhodovulum sulfidophilum]